MQFLSIFRWTSWIRMLKMLNMALICCPVVFFQKIIAVFYMKKSQKDTENDKSTKIFQFSKILCIFPRIFDALCGLGRLKGSTRKQCVVQ